MKKRLVVLTGAGMSVESGLSTFRDSGGLWDRYPVEDVATPEGWERNPALVQEFYNKRRKELLTVEPNKGHFGLAALEIHLHGELTKVRSTKNENRIYELSPDHYEIKADETDRYGDRLRPHIVWFGEAVPMIEPAIEITEEADIFVVIGTSLNVYPAAGLLRYVRPQVPIYLIDPKEVKVPVDRSVRVIQKGASEGVAELIALLRR